MRDQGVYAPGLGGWFVFWGRGRPFSGIFIPVLFQYRAWKPDNIAMELFLGAGDVCL